MALIPGRWLRRPVQDRAVFLHVPKCGGNSIRVALRGAFNWPLMHSRRKFFHVSPRRSQQVADLAGLSVHVLRDAMLRYHLRNPTIRFASGHYRWPSGLRDEFPELNLITLLREPVSHFLSAYYFQREERGQAERHRVPDNLDAYLESDRAIANGASFVRYFTAPDDPRDPRDDAVIDVAARRVVSVEVLGVLEDLPRLAAAFQHRFGVALRIPRANAGKLRLRLEEEEVSDAHRARIREIVRPNRVLYDAAMAELCRRNEAGLRR